MSGFPRIEFWRPVMVQSTDLGTSLLDAWIEHWPSVLDSALKLKPAQVLPGHGPMGGPEILSGQRDFLADLFAAVSQQVAAGKTPAAMQISLPGRGCQLGAKESVAGYRSLLRGDAGEGACGIAPARVEMTMRKSVWIGFAAFVLLTGSRWLLATAFPSDLPPLLEESLHEMGIGLVAIIIASSRKQLNGNSMQGMKIALYFILLQSLPSILISRARGGVSGLSGLALLTPRPRRSRLDQGPRRTDDFGANEGYRSLLLPALAGAGGAFTADSRKNAPGSRRQALAGLARTLRHPGSRLPASSSRSSCPAPKSSRQPRFFMLASGLVTGAFSSGVGAVWTWQGGLRELAFCTLIDAPIALLTVWLLRALEPVRFASRFQLVPIPLNPRRHGDGPARLHRHNCGRSPT